ncbi:hypothetical protein MNBD_ALPHA06-166 [hydrothermal vent metagenome]|uniref:Uncharacterized protein n=1 Tax=hydrothermal vent metagenome TaxID=652676 RepID=A0A3B0RHK6_9ZZZZ
MDTDYTGLLDEIPHLMRARAFADGLAAAPLFGRTGQKLDEQDREMAQLYAQNLGFPHIEPARLLHFAEALGAAESSHDDPETWEAEEQLRAALHMEALRITSEEGASALLQLVAGQTAEIARERAKDAFSHLPQMTSSEDAMNCLVGHVSRAAHCMALAILSDTDTSQPEHPFVLRWGLFNRGRWPVGITGSSFNLY